MEKLSAKIRKIEKKLRSESKNITLKIATADAVEQKIADIINSGVSLVNLRKHLESIFPKKDIDFVMMPVAHFRIKTKMGTLIIVNKKYADDVDIEAGELAIGYEKTR